MERPADQDKPIDTLPNMVAGKQKPLVRQPNHYVRASFQRDPKWLLLCKLLAVKAKLTSNQGELGQIMDDILG